MSHTRSGKLAYFRPSDIVMWNIIYNPNDAEAGFDMFIRRLRKLHINGAKSN